MSAKNPGAACRELARRGVARIPRRITLAKERDKEPARLLYLFTGDARTLRGGDTPKRRRAATSGGLEREHRERERRAPRFPRASAATRNAATFLAVPWIFFHLLIVPPWISLPTRALYPSVLRMLPTRLNGSLVRACTRLLRLLAATRSWHSYLNVIPDAAPSFSSREGTTRGLIRVRCVYVASPPPPISHFN